MSTATLDDSFVSNLLPAFIEEANEQVAEYEHLLLELEDDPSNHTLLDALFRCAHTVKGSAGMFGLTRVVGFTHHVETVLDQLREGRLTLTPDLSTLLLKSNDEIRRLIAGAQEADTPAAQAERDALASQLQALSRVAHASNPAAPPQPCQAQAPTASRDWRIDVAFGADCFRNGMDPLAILNYLSGMGELRDLHCLHEEVPVLDQIDAESCHLHFRFTLSGACDLARVEEAFSFVREDCTLSITGTSEQPEAAHAASAPAPAATRPREGPAGEEGGYIRVLANRLDEVINLLGELVIAGSGASQMARQTRHRGLIEANQQITRLIEGIRNSTLKLRMVPIGETFSRFRRVVRDTAAELGKDVALDIEGGDTELDKAVVERIADPLVHLVRNALDHGLETPEQRLTAGKPAQGRLRLVACHESGSVLIRIIDDGRGIQRQKVLERAWQRGLVEPGVVPPDEDIFKLIFAPGFSTAEKVTNLSGRGVGMDVVRSNIEALRGSIAIESTEGQGCCMEIRLPLTLAIIDGFLVSVGDSRFIFPLDTVVEVIASHASGVAVDRLGRGVVDLRGQWLPVIDLRHLYALPDGSPERCSIVVARIGTRRYGVLVDALLGQHQTVIKPLGRLLRGLQGISGSSILGSGEVALIFDVDALGQLAAGGLTPRPTLAGANPNAATAASPLTAGEHP